MIHEHEIQKVMAETGMDYLQARGHIKCRQIIQERIRETAIAQRTNSLIAWAAASVAQASETPCVPLVEALESRPK